MTISEATYERVALEDPDSGWELVCGRLRSRPALTVGHNNIIDALYDRLNRQLPRDVCHIRTNSGRLRIAGGTFYVPDLFVLPRELERRPRPDALEIYAEATPLVVEVWSPSAGDYDVEEKLREYQRRDDLEIWRIHPLERTLTVWRRQSDQSYQQSIHSAGVVLPAALPDVEIDIARLFE